MESFTISSVFEYLQNQQALQNPRNGGFRFGRKERVEAVFPKRVCDKIAARSASYYSWFLNKDKQGVPIRDYLRRLFEEDSYEVFREMEDKCSKLLISPDDRARISEDEWRELLALLGREVPLFVRGSEGEGRLEQIAEAVPARALACLFLVAGMGGMTQAQYEQLLTCWRLMDRNLISGEDMEPMRHVHAGELLYLDGNRGEALNQLIKAAVKLREGLRDESDMDIPGNSGIYDRSGNSGIPDGAGISGSPCNSDIPGISGNSGIRDMRGRQSDRELLGRVLLRIGEIYLLGGEDGENEEQAQKYLDQSVSMGCTKAYIPLAMLQWKKGQIRETRETLLKGAGAGVLSCLRTLGNSFYRGNEIACNKKDLRQAAEYYLRGSFPNDTPRGDPVCQYMLGRILEEEPGIIPLEKAAGPEYWYAAAARQGNEEAAARLNHLRWYAFGEAGALCLNEGVELSLRASTERTGDREPAGKPAVAEQAGSGQPGDKEPAGQAAAQKPGDKEPAGWPAVAEQAGSGQPGDKEPAGWPAVESPAVGNSGIFREKYCLLNSDSEISLLFAGSVADKEYKILICRGEQKDSEPVFYGLIHGGHGKREILQDERNSVDSRRIEIWPGTIAQALGSIGMRFLDEGKGRGAQYIREAFPEFLCAALDDSDGKNVRDGLQILRTAFLLHEKTGAFSEGGPMDLPAGTRDPLPENRKEKDEFFYLLSDRVKLYVKTEEKSAAPVFDSACSRLGDFYIPLFLCDRKKMSSAWLLDRLPLFIPCLEEYRRGNRRDNNWENNWESRQEYKHENRRESRWDNKRVGSSKNSMNVMIFGDHPGIIQLCKDIIAAAQIEDRQSFPFSLTVVGEKADLLEESFLSDCPGIADPPEESALDTPVFVKMDPQSRRFQSLLAAHPGRERFLEDEQLANRLQSANYLVVYTEDENRSLSQAMYLREWYLKTDPSFSRLPFIAVYCEKRERAEQLRTLTAGAESAGFGWHNNYLIEAFGREDQLFSYDALVRNRLEQRAMAAHFAYYTFTNREDRFRAEHDYFSRNYNRDSSLMNALALPYRLFSAGIAFSDWHDYAEGISQERLATQFDEWLEEKDRALSEDIEKLVMYEHGRWNRSMFSRGWLPATMGQMLAYIQRGNNRHQLYIAKLHPFLYSWDRLGDAGPSPTGIQKEYSAIMRQVRPDREPSDIRGIDRENVRRTAELVRSAP